ncbi:DUF6197 family protein [Streptomyces ardesiacus]|uniref:DUF6197 family protein n=1 Tax=Streptomyces ardesiacus TaxID=285564 RepID=UPI0036968FE2
MSRTDTYSSEPRTVSPSAAPTRAPQHPTTPPAPAVQPVITAPDWPSRWHLLIPTSIRNTAANLGLWQNPTPLKPSDHLTQTLAVLERYGWCRSLDFSPTGRMCIRGAQTLLERTGHVTPTSRARAVDYMQHTLTKVTDLPFYAWNDLPDRTFPQVKHLITTSAAHARTHGE